MEPTAVTIGTRPNRRYTDEEQRHALAILAENGDNAEAASRDTGIPASTIKDWREARVSVPSPSSVAQEKAKRATAWDKLQDLGVSTALEKLPTASARDAAIIAGIAVDKAALLRGESPGSGPAVVVNVNPRSITLTPDDIETARRILAGVRPVIVEPLPDLPDTLETLPIVGNAEGSEGE